MRSLIRAIDRLSFATGGLAALLVILLVVLMVYDAVARYAFSAPTLWAFDVATYLMGACFILSTAYTLSRDAHVRVDLVYAWLPRRVLTVVDLVGFAVIVLPVTAWIASGLWSYFYDSFLSAERSGSSAWNPRVWPFRLVLFVGFAVLCLQVAAEILRRIARLLGRPVEPDQADGTRPT